MIFTLHLGFEARQRGCRVRATGAVTMGLSVFPCAGGGLNITPQWLL